MFGQLHREVLFEEPIDVVEYFVGSRGLVDGLLHLAYGLG